MKTSAKLKDDVLVYRNFLYEVDGKVIRNPVVGRVRDMKKELGCSSVRSVWGIDKSQYPVLKPSECREAAPMRKPKKRGKTDNRVIEVVAQTNPHREGTAAHAFFQGMVTGETVQQYKDRYPDEKLQQDAMLYLKHNIKKQKIKLHDS